MWQLAIIAFQRYEWHKRTFKTLLGEIHVIASRPRWQLACCRWQRPRGLCLQGADSMQMTAKLGEGAVRFGRVSKQREVRSDVVRKNVIKAGQ
jgi:hypothetical protein